MLRQIFIRMQNRQSPTSIYLKLNKKKKHFFHFVVNTKVRENVPYFQMRLKKIYMYIFT